MLLYLLDHLDLWSPEKVAQRLGTVRSRQPMWLRVANFQAANLEVLSGLPAPQLVLWKLEHLGPEDPGGGVPRSGVGDLAAFAEAIFSLGHVVVPYTFTAFNRELFRRELPAFASRRMHVLPVAQKADPDPPELGRERGRAVRAELGIPESAWVYGAGGNLGNPGKRIEEVVAGFAATCPDPGAHLICSLITDVRDASAASRVTAAWTERFGAAAMARIHVHTGWYKEWEWMRAFYSATDVMLVNSVSDSWGRMVSEPMGLGAPVVVRRSACSTNHIAPGTAFVDDFADFGADEFADAVELAQKRREALRAYVGTHYAIPRVRAALLSIMRAETPAELRPELDRRACEPHGVSALDRAVVF